VLLKDVASNLRIDFRIFGRVVWLAVYDEDAEGRRQDQQRQKNKRFLSLLQHKSQDTRFKLSELLRLCLHRCFSFQLAPAYQRAANRGGN